MTSTIDFLEVILKARENYQRVCEPLWERQMREPVFSDEFEVKLVDVIRTSKLPDTPLVREVITWMYTRDSMTPSDIIEFAILLLKVWEQRPKLKS